VFVTLGLRVLAGARGNFSGALAVLQNADPVEVVVGMGIQLLPLVPLVVGASLIFVRATSDRGGARSDVRGDVAFVVMVAGLAVIMAALLVPNRSSALIGLGVGCVLVLLAWAIRRKLWPFGAVEGKDDGQSRWATSLRRSARSALTFTAVVYLVLALSPTMWLPREVIARRGARSLVGFVLSTDTDSTVVLTSRARRVTHIDTGSIRTREICELDGRDRPLLFAALGGSQPGYERCARP
jgi:hypothetical protein